MTHIPNHMAQRSKAAKLMLPGVWLVFDAEDEPERQWAVFAHTEGSEFDTIMIAWTGVIMTPENEGHYTQRCAHAAGFNDRYEMRRLSPVEITQLDMAAIHGVFSTTAARIWERLT